MTIAIMALVVYFSKDINNWVIANQEYYEQLEKHYYLTLTDSMLKLFWNHFLGLSLVLNVALMYLSWWLFIFLARN
jgi:hypothetical protein